VVAPGGRILVASSFDGLRVTDDLCNWKSITQFDQDLVADVVVAPDALWLLTSTGSAAGIDGSIWRSTDNGETWAQVGGKLPRDLAATALAVPAPDRMYVTGGVIQTGDAATSGTVDALERSDDGGQTWTRFPVPAAVQNATLRIHGVLPGDPDAVFVWFDLSEVLNQDSIDEIWMTPDGGTTWKQVYVGAGDLPGLAFSPDGKRVAIAGPKEGVRTAALSDVETQGPTAFTEAFDQPVWGLSWTDSALFAGNNDFAAAGIERFTFGRSVDDGQSFSPIMNICQVEFPACDPSSTQERACREIFEQEGGFKADYLDSDRCLANNAPPTTSPDGGITGGPKAGGSSKDDSGCSFAGNREAGGEGTLVGAGLLGLAAALRRRRARGAGRS